MSAPRNRYKLAEAKRQMVDKIGGEKIVIELDDGFTVEMDHPLFRPKSIKDALKPLDDDDSDGIAEVVLGDQYEDFILHGGDPDDLMFVFLAASEATRDTLAGRKRPTQS